MSYQLVGENPDMTDRQTDMSLGLCPASYKLDELTKFLTAPRQFSHLKKMKMIVEFTSCVCWVD